MSKKEKSITIRREADGTIKTEFVNCDGHDDEMLDILNKTYEWYIKLQDDDSQKKK